MVPKKFYCVLAILFVCGCASVGGGRMTQSTETGVTLKEGNYKVVKAGASGTSRGFYLLGFIPIAHPRYANAKISLYKSVGEPLEGRSIALANTTEDRSTLYLLLFSIPKIVISADVVEFYPSAAKK